MTEEITQKIENPLIARAKLPGETFAIPSMGLFYDNNELDETVKNGEVHIFPMAAYDEILIKTPSLLLNGDAVEKIFNRCVPQIKKPMELLAKDVDFLLIALRQVTYGPSMEMTYTHSCKDAKNHTYAVDISKIIKDAKKINPTMIGKEYTKTLSNEQVIQIQPARYKSIVAMLQHFALGQRTEDMTDEMIMAEVGKETDNLLDSIQSVIRSVDGIKDPTMIREWLVILQANIISELSGIVDNTSNWGPSFEYKTKCKDCKKSITISVPINPISFFT